MALGGGNFLDANKILPGTYINFISANRANKSFSERGFATMPLELDWGIDGEIFTVTADDFAKNSVKLFGYKYNHEKLKGLRDLFINLKTLYAYRLNSGNKATNTYATAKYSGTRGNNLKIVIAANVDEPSKFDVSVYLGTEVIDTQCVASSAELLDNDFVVWKKEATLQATAGLALSGGTNGVVSGGSHQAYLDKIEGYSFNVLGVATTDDAVKQLYVNFTKRMREDTGVKFQTVLYRKNADYDGVISVKNRCLDGAISVRDNISYPNETAIVYWVTGLEASCEIHKSCLNKIYTGEYDVDCNYTQAQLETALRSGEFVLHKVGADIRVLSDINSMITTTDVKSEVFKNNQTIRVLDQIANDTATLFNTKFLGSITNDASGRVSLWTDLVKHHEGLQKIKAIENFNPSDITVDIGQSKQSIVITDKISVANAMSQIYMTLQVG